MSHNINENRVFAVGEPAWHGIGTVLDNPATAVEAITAARLDYNVNKKSIFVWKDQVGGKTSSVSDRYATVREDNGQPLGIVGNRYQIVQNKDAFGFFDSIVGEGQAIYHTAGALGQGEKIWILAKLPNDIIVKKDDVVEKYLVLMNTHDGSTTLRMFFTPIRVVCQNTLTAALHSRSNEINIRHSGNVVNKVSLARETLGIAIKYYGEFEEVIKRLADRQLTEKEVKHYFNYVVFMDETKEKDSTQLKNKRDKLLTLFERGKGNDMKDIRGTAWSAYNAVTEYVDHQHKFKGQDKDQTVRLDNIWFGSGSYFKQRAFNAITKLIGLN